jgi:hypothetical protein
MVVNVAFIRKFSATFKEYYLSYYLIISFDVLKDTEMMKTSRRKDTPEKYDVNKGKICTAIN